jgi:hypothetical protein
MGSMARAFGPGCGNARGRPARDGAGRRGQRSPRSGDTETIRRIHRPGDGRPEGGRRHCGRPVKLGGDAGRTSNQRGRRQRGSRRPHRGALPRRNTLVSPLAPTGPLTLAFEWPALGIPPTRVDMSRPRAIDAAERPPVPEASSGGRAFDGTGGERVVAGRAPIGRDGGNVRAEPAAAALRAWRSSQSSSSGAPQRNSLVPSPAPSGRGRS